MIKIALINPGKNQTVAQHEPLNLGYLAAYLIKHNVEVKIFDQLVGQNIQKEVLNYKPDVVGITGTSVVILDAYEIARWCREQKIFTVMGGVHCSTLPEEALQHCDVVVVGEGEEALLKIAKSEIKQGIVNMSYLKDIDVVPLPVRNLMQMDFYLKTKDRLPATHLHFVPFGAKTSGIISQRGCPYKCIFCHNAWREYPLRSHSPQRVIEEIKYLINTYKVNALFFMDDDFLAKKSRVKRIYQLWKEAKLNLIWGCQATVNEIDEESLKLIQEIGCKQITFGFESGSQRIVDILKNGKMSLEKNIEAVKLCKKTGILACATFMLGNPTETEEDLKLTVKFIKENNLDGIGVHIATPFPGTEMWQWCEKNNLIPQNFNWKDFNTGQISILACNTLSPQAVQKYYNEIVSDILKNKPISFSNLISNFFKNPWQNLTKIFYSPAKIITVLKKLKLRYLNK